MQEWVKPIVTDLMRLLRRRTRDFDFFAGVTLYDQLRAYIPLMEQLYSEVKGIKRVRSLLERTIQQVRKALRELTHVHDKIEVLLPLFQEVRGLLGAVGASPVGLRARTTAWKSRLRSKFESVSGEELGDTLKYKRITADSSLAEVLAEWTRLFSTHEFGLFHFLEVTGLPRSNVAIERRFSLETHHFRAASGLAQVGNQIRVKGGELCLALQEYHPDLIKRTLLSSDRNQIKEGRQKFRQRQKIQSASWHFKHENDPEIIRLLEKAGAMKSHA